MKCNYKTRLRELQAASGNSKAFQEMISELLGITRSSYYRLANAKYGESLPVDIERLQIISRALDIPLTELYNPLPLPEQAAA